jgi:hypothetical protein
MKKLFGFIAVMLMLVSVGQAASRRGHYDLVVAPARYSVMQVMFDVVANRPSILVSYQGEATTAEPLLHVWNGTAWSPISLHDLREMSFVQKTPTRAILIGNDELLPESVRESLAWMPEVVFVRDLNNASLLNEFGRIQQWSKREWNWFSTRYNLALEDEAAPLRNRSWYDRPASSLNKNPEPSYKPVPVIAVERQPMPPPATLPLKDEVIRPTDVPAAEVAPAPVSDAATVVVVQSASVEATSTVPEALQDVAEKLQPEAVGVAAEPTSIK